MWKMAPTSRPGAPPSLPSGNCISNSLSYWRGNKSFLKTQNKLFLRQNHGDAEPCPPLLGICPKKTTFFLPLPLVNHVGSFLYPAKYEISFQWIETFFIVVWILAQLRNWSKVDKKGVSCQSAHSTQNVHSRLVKTTCWSAHRIVLVHRCLVV